jgi:hypothetical protein
VVTDLLCSRCTDVQLPPDRPEARQLTVGEQAENTVSARSPGRLDSGSSLVGWGWQVHEPVVGYEQAPDQAEGDHYGGGGGGGEHEEHDDGLDEHSLYRRPTAMTTRWSGRG